MATRLKVSSLACRCYQSSNRLPVSVQKRTILTLFQFQFLFQFQWTRVEADCVMRSLAQIRIRSNLTWSV